MKRERKALTEKGLLKLIERIKNGEEFENQYRTFREYNITIAKAHRTSADKARWYYKFHPEVVEKLNKSQRKLRASRKEKGLCIRCGEKAIRKKGKTYVMCEKCHEKHLKQQRERKQKKQTGK